MRIHRILCDRCLTEIKSAYNLTQIKVENADDPGYELCLSCYLEFKNIFMAEKKAKMMAQQDDDQPCPPMPKGEQK